MGVKVREEFSFQWFSRGIVFFVRRQSVCVLFFEDIVFFMGEFVWGGFVIFLFSGLFRRVVQLQVIEMVFFFNLVCGEGIQDRVEGFSRSFVLCFCVGFLIITRFCRDKGEIVLVCYKILKTVVFGKVWKFFRDSFQCFCFSVVVCVVETLQVSYMGFQFSIGKVD